MTTKNNTYTTAEIATTHEAIQTLVSKINYAIKHGIFTDHLEIENKYREVASKFRFISMFMGSDEVEDYNKWIKSMNNFLDRDVQLIFLSPSSKQTLTKTIIYKGIY